MLTNFVDITFGEDYVDEGIFGEDDNGRRDSFGHILSKVVNLGKEFEVVDKLL